MIRHTLIQGSCFSFVFDFCDDLKPHNRFTEGPGNESRKTTQRIKGPSKRQIPKMVLHFRFLSSDRLGVLLHYCFQIL